MKTRLIILALISSTISFAQTELSLKQQNIIAISAFTANGDQVLLKTSLNEGLDAGLTVNEIKEVLVQLYAYAGFPRSLNALGTFMSVVKERQQRGINDLQGQLPGTLHTDKSKLVFGTEMQTKLVGGPVRGEVYSFAPAIDQFLKEHLFADIFGRDNLDWKTRELATITALAAIGKAETQLRSHIGVGMRNGLTAGEMESMVSVIRNKLGRIAGDSAASVLDKVLGRNQQAAVTSIARNPTMTGKVSVEMIPFPAGSIDMQVGSVSFEAGARTYWHKHPAGQVLVVTDGIGAYQEKGTSIRIIRKGDVVNCAPDVVHWHGAIPGKKMTHIAITGSNASGRVVWLEEVTEAEYNYPDYGLLTNFTDSVPRNKNLKGRN